MKDAVDSRVIVTPLPDDWVDEFLLSGPDEQVCLRLDGPVDRAALRGLVDEQRVRLADAGLTKGGTVALRLPPSLTYVATLLAAWRLGAQVSLLDHRLTQHEVDRALDRVAAQFVVEPVEVTGNRMRGYSDVIATVTARPTGRPAATPHALVQFSSGSTGASKVIARTAADLVGELDRYARLAEFPHRGDRVVLLASVVHVLGLVGGLLNGLHAGVQLVFPQRLTATGILAAVAEGDAPTTILGVPFHAELLATVEDPPALPQLVRMIVAGELVRPSVPPAFTARYGVPLGTMYGMTELGVIATDLSGTHWPSVAPAHGMDVRVAAGELRIRMPASPYLGLSDPTRFADGWLRTKDAAAHDEETGLVTILGRLDSQISIGGLKVDLTEVERTIAALPEVTEAVVVHDGEIEAYLALTDKSTVDTVEAAIARELAAFKRPRRIHVLAALPRTATGKIVRDSAALRAAAPHHP
ncbi:acyl--CoA ligase [Solihabitans fulvus]|uniref:Acyl--CoA ligase n=1 Tax=Solihabitans fulvus TaxID=1892852 RepID=A0A5B2X2C7_9PSEU|nr:class I adenylate-forming enzyme family protein [Solihabitans fulvus]KAA2257280.1 acyl--CoA ligase [Solihabitans fulvus]